MLDFGGVTWKYRKYGNLLWHAWIRANQNAKKRNKKPNYLNWGANLATIDVAYKIASLLMKGFKSQMCESNWHHFWKTARWTKYSLGCPPSPIIVTSKILTFLGLKQSQPKPTHLSHWAHSHASSATPFRMKGDDCTRYHLDQWMISKSIQVSKKNHDQSTNPVVSWQSVSTKKIKAWR